MPLRLAFYRMVARLGRHGAHLLSSYAIVCVAGQRHGGLEGGSQITDSRNKESGHYTEQWRRAARLRGARGTIQGLRDRGGTAGERGAGRLMSHLVGSVMVN